MLPVQLFSGWFSKKIKHYKKILSVYPKPQAILVDLDGTLVDNTLAVAQTYYECLLELGLDPLPIETILGFSGKSTYDTAKAMGVPKEHWDFVDSFFWDRFYEKVSSPEYKVKLIPGAADFLKKCKGDQIPIGVVTSNNKRNATTVLKKAGLLPFIDVVIAKDDVKKPKPDPEPLLKALDSLDVDVKDHKSVWFIGDSESDYFAALKGNFTFFMIRHNGRRFDVPSFVDFFELMSNVCD